MLKQLQILLLLLFFAGLVPEKAFAQFPYTDSFMNSTAPGANFGGSPTAYLTGGNIDPNGNGYLRLTSNANSQAGYTFISSSFPATKGISVNFEYATWGGNGNADGICFFLFDGSLPDASFKVGQFGGSLGYSAATPSTAGLSNAYLGIGFDEYGNFSNSAFGAGGTGAVANSVTIRGAYNDSRGAYYMLKNVPLSTATHGFNTIGSGASRVATQTTGYRKAYIDIVPDASGVGFDITVKIQHDGVSTPVTIISNYYYNYASPASLKFGYAASTGGSNNFHEIRNTAVDLPASSKAALASPTQTNQTLTTCSNSAGSVNISSGFSTTNGPNGVINTSSIDLNTAVAGTQTSYTVASKGTFNSDGSGTITFTPSDPSVSGTAVCSFTVADNYGATSNTATVTATINAIPTLTITNPAAACSPATVNITAAAVTAGSDAGLTLSYYSDAAATTSLNNPSAITSSGTYYIKALNANNCSVIRPVTVTVNPQPTTANAGTDQTVTVATPASVTLNGNSPAVGSGLWSQLSGPTTANFANPALYNTAAGNLSPGAYVFRWTISTATCGNSTDDVTINIIGTQSITFNNIPAKAYGDADFNAGATASSGLAVTYSSSNPAVATVDANGLIHILTAGNTSITASQAGNSNYAAATSVTKTLTVNKASQTITFAALPAKTYGDVDFDGGATSNNTSIPIIYSSNNLNVATIVNGNIHIIGVGTTVITASQAGDSNNTSATPVQQTLTVNPANLTMTAENQGKSYGTPNPELIISYNGFVNGETTASLTTLPSISTTATTNSPVGSYPITVTGAAAANYNFTYVTGNLTIAPSSQTITFTAQPKTYGNADFTLGATTSSGLPVTYTSSNPAVATVDVNGVVHIVSAGIVTISATQPGNNNYNATTTINQQLVINKAALTISADSQTKTYGAANPALIINYNGFVYNDSPASLTVQPAISTTATSTSAAGTYPIKVSGATAANYDITYTDGLFTVDKSSQAIAFTALPSKIYGDTDFAPGATSDNSTIAITYTSDNTAVATIVNGKIHITGAGTATITAAQAGNSNFIDAANVTQILTVNKASLSLTANSLNKVYGDANPALTIAYVGFVNSETASVLTSAPVISTTATAASGAGVYPIAIKAAAATNYNITYTTGILTIAKAALTITADNKTRFYGLPNPPLTVNYSGFVNGDANTTLATQPTVSTTATTTSAAGPYPITTSGAASSNYAITYVPGVLTVTNPTVNSISLASVMVFENQPSGTPAGTLSASSLDPNAIYTYSLVTGTGSTDNTSFSILGNKLVTAKSLDYEGKSSYSVLIRATNQYGLYLDKIFTINLTDVNEAPTLAAIANQTLCFTYAAQSLSLTGITPGPETAQSTTLSVSSTQPGLFTDLKVSSLSNGTATLNYQLAGLGTAVVTVTVKDNGGTANGGTDTFTQSFTITANELPVADITSDKGIQISKGETVMLTATGGSSYSWDTTPNVSGASSSAVIKVRPGVTTTYQVKVSNASGCSSVKNITINVADDYSAIDAANILTPNGDGKNDTWVVKNLDMYPDNTVSIYDKGGRKLLEVKHYNNDWDGSFHGSALTEGTYYYVIDFGTGKGLKKGFITILRNR